MTLTTKQLIWALIHFSANYLAKHLPHSREAEENEPVEPKIVDVKDARNPEEPTNQEESRKDEIIGIMITIFVLITCCGCWFYYGKNIKLVQHQDTAGTAEEALELERVQRTTDRFEQMNRESFEETRRPKMKRTMALHGRRKF